MVIIEDILSLCTPMLNQSISHIMKVSLLLYLYIETSNLHFQDQLKTRPLSSFSSFDNPRHLSSFSSFDNPRGRQIQKAPLRTRSMLAAFFVKHRSAKMKNVSVRWSTTSCSLLQPYKYGGVKDMEETMYTCRLYLNLVY